MCGIVCGQGVVSNESIERALKKVAHRGPDAQRFIRVNEVFLGHTRLSIVDVSGGDQPLVNEDHTIFASVNGEFYDHEDIRNELKRKGHVFRTQSDSEILIHLYEEQGVECLERLNGEFAFALYDKNKKRWFCARDRAGVRPLHYQWDSSRFLVASEAKSILSFDGRGTLDRESLWFAQHVQYLPLDKTMFEGVRMVQPGHFLLCEERQEPRQTRYWSPRKEEQKNVSFEDAVETSERLLRAAVKKRIPKEVSWATHLSGGLDSSLVTALANQERSTTSFTIQFTDDNVYDESAFAEETAKHLGVSLITIPVDAKALIEAIPKAVFHGEGMSINGHLGAKYILNQEIRRHGFKVALSGEGSDELFMGYSHLKQDYLSNASLNTKEKSILSGFQIPDANMLDVAAAKFATGSVPTWLQAKASMGFKLKQLWHSEFKVESNPYARMSEDLKGYSSPLKAASGSWMEYCLSGYILKVLDDGQSMAHSVEGRVPFLDRDVMDFALSLPDDLYFKDNVEKAILRRGFKGLLPASTIARTKQSFMSPPMHRFLKNKAFVSLMEEYVLENKTLQNLQVFDRAAVAQFVETAANQEAAALEPILMTVLSFGVLAKEFL
jgi:asparagine synthase (glutamine-hydrolysing)